MIDIYCFRQEIDHNLSLVIPEPDMADEMFDMIEKNRTFLKKWLQWLDQVVSIYDTKKFIKSVVKQAVYGNGLQCAITLNNSLVGMVGFCYFEKHSMIGRIGYWLDEAINGQGIMTKSVRQMISIGFSQLHLEKIEICCHIDNVRSRAIPKRLSFRQEGILYQSGNLYGTPIDQAVYSMNKSEWIS